MTHRERVLAAVSHRQPDKVPIDLGGTRDSSLVVEAYEKVKKYFGVEDKNPLCDRMMRVVHVDERILKALDIDTRAVFPGGPTQGPGAGTGPPQIPRCLGRRPGSSGGKLLLRPDGVPSVRRNLRHRHRQIPLARPGRPRIWCAGSRNGCAWIRENTDCAAILTLPAPFVHISQYLRGFEDWFCDIMLNPQETRGPFRRRSRGHPPDRQNMN